MTNSLITPEVVDQDLTILEESPMTESEEKELVIVKTAIQTAYADKLNAILRRRWSIKSSRKLYRGKNGGRTWTLASRRIKELTSRTGSRATPKSFYRFRWNFAAGLGSAKIALPPSPK